MLGPDAAIRHDVHPNPRRKRRANLGHRQSISSWNKLRFLLQYRIIAQDWIYSNIHRETRDAHLSLHSVESGAITKSFFSVERCSIVQLLLVAEMESFAIQQLHCAAPLYTEKGLYYRTWLYTMRRQMRKELHCTPLSIQFIPKYSAS